MLRDYRDLKGRAARLHEIEHEGDRITGDIFALINRTFVTPFEREADVVHVLIARHRPESNGIAERFVRTLKEELAAQTWDTPDELAALLAQFRAAYNARPHQGLGIPGLSPTEFAQRIWLL